MVCGLCHREPDDHSQSTSSPSRCGYDSHRENCPGGFRTSCEEHQDKLEKDSLDTEDLVKKTDSLDLDIPPNLEGTLQLIKNQNGQPGSL